jgi:Tol biopolymer transport system component
VFSVPAAGGAARQLTTDRDGGSKYFPVMSPDGRWVAYVWERPALSTYALAVVPAAGGRPRVLDSDVVKASAPSWSRDSRYVAYARWNGPDAAASTYTDLFRVDARSGARRNLTAGRFQGTPQASWQGSVMNPTFSPDGARIAFAYVAGPRPAARGDLYVLDANGGATRVNGAAPVAMYSTEAGFAWSPDGQRVVFPYIDSDADPSGSQAWSWNEGLASTHVGAPLYGPLLPGQVADVTVR